jgi:K+-sensing histidine kinase KdpD
MPDDAPRVLSLLSHELRGPLGVVRGYLRLLDQSAPELSEKSRQAIAGALRASDRMVEVLDEASLLVHFRAGDIRLDPKRVPLATIVHSAIQAAALPERSQVDLDSAALPAVTLDVDEARLRMALATFITAVARAQSNKVVVDISAARTRLSGKPAVRLRVEARTLSGVQGSEVELNTTRGGFGLAIPIAALIIEGHGGRVRELRHGDRSAGLLVSLPVCSKPATGPLKKLPRGLPPR